MAQTKITSTSLDLQSVDTKNIKDRSIVSSKIGLQEVKTENILDNSIGLSKMTPDVNQSFSNFSQMLPLSGGTMTGLIRNTAIPAFSVLFNLRQAAVNTTIKLINAEGVSLNYLNCYNNSNGRFTAPVNGIYYFSFQANRSNQGGSTPQVKIVRNDTDNLAIGLLYTTAYISTTLNVVTYLTQNQYVHCESNGVNSGAPDLWSAQFSGFLINQL